ncbi:MAG: phytanoyl-CoA dioxygenase family protein [Microthrixaceae bacterium]
MERPRRMPTDDEITTFWRDGVVVLRDVLDPADVAALAPSVAAAFGGDATGDLTAMAGDPGDGAGRFRGGIDHWLVDPVMRDFATASPLPSLVAALLRTELLFLYEDSILVKSPGTREETKFHTDLPYFQVEGDQLATTWCPLDEVTPETGSLRFVRGSHEWGRDFRPNLFVTDDPLPGTEGEVLPAIDPDDPSVLCPTLGPGDLTVHHARTVHGAGPNTSTTTWRRAVSVRYCGDDARVHLRPGLPVSAHHRGLVEGEPLHDGDATPQVWPPR